MTHPRTKNASRKHRKPRPLWEWILAAVLATFVVGAILMYVFAAISGYGAPPLTKRPGARPELYDITRSAVAAGAFLGAAVVAAITVRRQRSTELSFEADELSRLRDRYTTAAGQLGHESPAVRLAGTYALAALADEWLNRKEPAEAQTSIDLLCAYMRTPREHLNDADKAADREIRQSIIRIITNHLQETSQPSWSDRHFDFTDAIFDGRYDFRGAKFSGDRVSFDGATFSGAVSFLGVKFSSAVVSFAGATFSGDVSFMGATFSCLRVDFSGVTFAADHASFEWATFSGVRVYRFGYKEIAVSADHVSFAGATFSDGEVSFLKATFSSGRVSFKGLKFSGGWVSFEKTAITEGCKVLGPWPDGPLPKRWPIEGELDPAAASSGPQPHRGGP